MTESLENYAEVDALRAANQRLQQQLRKATAKTDDLVEAVTKAAYDAALIAGPLPLTPVPSKDNRRKEEVALWDLGDWQGAKLTSTYNSQVMRDRVMQFCTKAQRITMIQRADHPVKRCVIIFGGDQVEGLFNFPQQPFEVDSSLFEQYVNVSRLLVDVVRFALSVYDKVTVVSEWGNHGRIGSKRSAVPRSDNVDRMCYELARQLLAGEWRLTWQDCPEDIQRLEVGSYRALVIHGDEFGRNGFASRSTIVQHVNRWRSGAYRVDGLAWEFRDCYVHHYHLHAEDPLANGEGAVYWTGSTESDNRYAQNALSSAGIPSQRLHFVDPVKGRVTSAYKIWLD